MLKFWLNREEKAFLERQMVMEMQRQEEQMLRERLDRLADALSDLIARREVRAYHAALTYGGAENVAEARHNLEKAYPPKFREMIEHAAKNADSQAIREFFSRID